MTFSCRQRSPWSGLCRLLLLAVVAVGCRGVVAQDRPHDALREGRPNIVFLLSDDHHYDALGFTNPALRTPHLDRLAREGVHFTRAFSPFPICMTARATIFTGQDPWTNGTAPDMNASIHPDAPRWPQVLADAGYETFFTGKWHNDGQPATRGFTAGANIWRGGPYDHRRLPVHQYGEDRDRRQPAETYSSTLFSDSALEFLEERDRDRPFLLFVSFTVPHDPWTPPREYEAMYRMEDMPLPPNYRPTPPFKIKDSFPSLRDQIQLPWPRPEWAVRAALTQYYAMITHMDEQIGRLLDRLDERGMAENTLVMFVGDQGYSMASHGFVGKQTMYEEGIRTPLIVRYPRLPRGRAAVEQLVSLTDLFPTILEAAGLAVPAGVEGHSLLRLYQGEESWPRQTFFASFHSPRQHEMSTRSIRTTRHKLIQHLLTDELELFDLQADPYEMNNLAGRPEHAALQRDLTARLNAWRAGTPHK